LAVFCLQARAAGVEPQPGVGQAAGTAAPKYDKYPSGLVVGIGIDFDSDTDTDTDTDADGHLTAR
jgi:hypothetical protein